MPSLLPVELSDDGEWFSDGFVMIRGQPPAGLPKLTPTSFAAVLAKAERCTHVALRIERFLPTEKTLGKYWLFGAVNKHRPRHGYVIQTAARLAIVSGPRYDYIRQFWPPPPWTPTATSWWPSGRTGGW